MANIRKMVGMTKNSGALHDEQRGGFKHSTTHFWLKNGSLMIPLSR